MIVTVTKCDLTHLDLRPPRRALPTVRTMADSDSDAASVDEQNTFDSQDDMWPVIEITAEDKRKGYKVRWAGEDPSTGKPWAQSWVAKTEVTDHLRRTWEASGKGQKKKKRKSCM